jgi:hypothetical protein
VVREMVADKDEEESAMEKTLFGRRLWYHVKKVERTRCISISCLRVNIG